METDKSDNNKISIIGVGNMGQAITLGLLTHKMFVKSSLFLSNSSKDNKRVAKASEIIILAVKPQQIKQVLLNIRDVLSQDQLIISIAAGVEIETIKKILNKKQPIIRVMPNLNSVVGKSISVWIKSKEVSKSQTEIAKKILSCLGKEFQTKNESDLNKATAISGSGPAYVFYLVELLEQAGLKLGLGKELATSLSLQTVVGSAYFLEKANRSASLLRSEVTSKGGTTEAAFKEFAKLGLDKVFLKGVESAYQRAKLLSFK